MNKFSVIMAVYDNGQDLETYLPTYLTQVYEPGYEVIVVDESSTDNTDDVLKLLKQQYPHLYTTFLPKPDIHVIRRRLALTIGVKAAKNEWIIFTRIDFHPTTETWLQTIAESLDDSTSMLLGYNRKDQWVMRSFDTIDEATDYIVKGERTKADGHKGKRLKKLRGKYDFVAVRHNEAHELLKSFDQPVGLGRLLGLRLRLFFRNLF